MKIKNARIIASLMAFTLAISALQPVYANPDKDAEDMQEMSDEEWDKVKDELTDFDDPEDPWDHETWDAEHKELVWVAFCMTEWTDGSFPSLNFTEFGTSTIDVEWLNDDDIMRIGDYIKDYKYISGVYSIKNAQDGTVDNSAYVPLVIACMDTLRGYGSGNDPYAIQHYVTGGTYLSKSYSTDSEYYERNIARLIFRTLVNAEKYYNQSHKPKSANIYNAYSEADGLLMMLQSVVLGSVYAKQSHYSEDTAAAYFESSKRGNYGYYQWDNFASVVLSKYHPTETENQYIMDGFGERIKTNIEYDDKGNEIFKKKK